MASSGKVIRLFPPAEGRAGEGAPPHAPQVKRPESALGELGLLAFILAVGAIPLLGEWLEPGRWGAGEVGLSTALVLLAGRELVAEAIRLRRRRRIRSLEPRRLP